MDTALRYYGYSDRTPGNWHLAVSKDSGKSRFRIDYPFVKPYYIEPAVLEGFILDVLQNYMTYDTCFKIVKTSEDNPDVPASRAAKVIRKYQELHGHSLRLLRQHRQPRPGQAHQRGVHRPDCQRSPPANAGGRLAGRQGRRPMRARLA